jgi:hypothetical protein
MRNVSKLEKKLKHILQPTHFFSENCAIYDIIRKNTIKPDRTYNMAYAHCRLDNSEYVTIIDLPRQQ